MRWAARLPHRRAVKARVGYARDSTVRPERHAADPSRSVMPIMERRTRFFDMRGANPAPSLDVEGFTLLPQRTRARDLTDPAEVAAVYLPEMAEFVRGLTGASQIFMLDNYVLRSERHPKAYPADVMAAGPARMVHVDYTGISVRHAARAAMRSHGAAGEPEGRIVAYTLWRSLTPPPQDTPLALCDLRTIAPEDLVTAESIDEHGKPMPEGQFYLMQPRPRHRWCYYSNMSPDELLIFRQHDSASPSVSGCPHTAFVDPRVRGAVPRLSIEVRAYALLEQGAPSTSQL